MKILVTGSTGQLGHDVVKRLEYQGHIVFSPTHSEMDICDAYSVQKYIQMHVPDAIVHCAAWTAVDLAEDEPIRCRNANVNGTYYIAEQCRLLNIPLMYFSTDYVFNGTGEKPWDIEDKMDPVNVYGKSKCDGEKIVRALLDKYFIIRISWVFGINGNNFVKTMLRLATIKNKINVVVDQIGSPTYTYDLAILICEMIVTNKYGTYHAHNEGFCSWYEFANKIFSLKALDITVCPIASDNYPMKAERPRNGRLNTSSLFNSNFSLLPSWENAIERYLKELTNEE